MPAIKVMNQADSPNAVNGLKFENIPPGGATLDLFAAGVTVGDDIGLSAGGGEIDFLSAADVNIEVSADVVDTGRDQILDGEDVPEGKLFLPVNVTTALGFHIILA